MPGDEVAEVTVYVFLSDHFVKTVYVSKNMNNVVMATVTYKKMMTSQVIQTMWLIAQLINPNNIYTLVET